MFDSQVLLNLAKQSSSPLEKLSKVEDRLRVRFLELERPIRALILSVASGEPLLLIGPPGTGKSRLTRAFCGILGLIDENDLSKKESEHYFEYLLTPFTEPSELFGFYDIEKAMKGEKLERIEEYMMQKAKVVYLDDVFNGSSAILNSILTFMNERFFHDRGERKKVAMQCLFGATNQIPETAGLQAVFDRFVLRCTVDNVAAHHEELEELLKVGWIETYTQHRGMPELKDLLDEIEAFRKRIVTLTAGEELKPQPDTRFYRCLAQLVQMAREYGLSEVSNRRLIKMAHIMLVHRIYEAVRRGELGRAGAIELSLGPEELKLLPRYFLDHMDQEIMDKMERAVDHCWQSRQLE